MGDFQDAFTALLGKNAPRMPCTPRLSPPVIARLRDEWQADYTSWTMLNKTRLAWY